MDLFFCVFGSFQLSKLSLGLGGLVPMTFMLVLRLLGVNFQFWGFHGS